MPHREFRRSLPLALSCCDALARSWPAALEHLIRLRIQTKEETTPMEVLNDAVHALVLEVNKMQDQFSDQVDEWKKRNQQQDM